MRGESLRFIFILLLIFAFNFTIALIIDRADDLCRLIGTAIGVCANLLFLGILKYFDFVVINANWLAGENWISTAPWAFSRSGSHSSRSIRFLT